MRSTFTQPVRSTRRDALCRLVAGAAWPMLALPTSGCGGGGDEGGGAEPPPAAAATPLSRLKAALLRAAPVVGSAPVDVSQGVGNAPASTLGAGALMLPPAVNPQGLHLGTVPQLWGWRRDRWSVQSGAVIAGQVVHPVHRPHDAAHHGSRGVCGLHFHMRGVAFEVLFAGTDVRITLVADGQYLSPGEIRTTLNASVPGAALNAPNTFVRIDFGWAAPRRVSLYARSSQGPCALVFAADDVVGPWDRSDEPAMAALADSYGGANGPHWGLSGPFWEAAAQLGIPHLDLDAIGGTGYAPNSVPGFGSAGDAFAARLPSSVDTRPDLLILAGGINDNNSLALSPYATAEAAREGFRAAVQACHAAARAALPDSVLVSLGPWAPRQFTPTNAVAQSKADVILEALRAVGGPWVFLDNLNGGWRTSSGSRDAGSGPWQTGTGHAGNPQGDGNGDAFLGADGVHPNTAGCAHLGTRIAADLRQALPTL